MNENIIRVKDLKKSFGDVTAVNEISFDVQAGSFFAFLGQNGAGKSTTINMLIGLLSSDNGDIAYADGKTALQFKSEIGVVFQNNVFDDRLTVKENLQLYGTFFMPKRTEMLRRYDETVSIFGLTEIAKKTVFNTLGRSKTQSRNCAGYVQPSKSIVFRRTDHGA